MRKCYIGRWWWLRVFVFWFSLSIFPNYRKYETRNGKLRTKQWKSLQQITVMATAIIIKCHENKNWKKASNNHLKMILVAICCFVVSILFNQVLSATLYLFVRYRFRVFSVIKSRSLARLRLSILTETFCACCEFDCICICTKTEIVILGTTYLDRF